MTEVHVVREGSSPLLISVPHDGRQLPDSIEQRMTPAGRDIPDTDWHVAKLYEFADELGASVLVANFSRYVVDLNRPSDDAALYEGQVATGICPQQTFAGENIYLDGEIVNAEEQAERVHSFWQPYHSYIEAKLSALRQEFGYALLWDAHSIPSIVPRLFDGELPVLNVGTNDTMSCAETIADDVFNIAASSDYETVMNDRFKGGFITRNYGDPENNVHAVQLEIAQRAYMDETSRDYDDTKAEKLRATLRAMIETFIASAARPYD
jgi:N-formylglutamate deformylase